MNVKLIREIISFFIFGLTNNFCFVLINSVAADFLKASNVNINVGIFLLFNTVPGIFYHLIFYRYFVNLNFNLNINFVFIAFALVLILITFTNNIWYKLFIVLINSFLSAFGEQNFFLLLDLWSNDTITRSYTAGTGLAGIAGSGFYLLVSTKLSLNNRLYSLSSILILGFLAFNFLLPEKREREREVLNTNLETTKTITNTDEYLLSIDKVPSASDPLIQSQSSPDYVLSVKEYFLIIKNYPQYILPLSLGYFLKYTLNKLVFQQIVFNNFKFTNITFYVFSLFIHQSGIAVGRIGFLDYICHHYVIVVLMVGFFSFMIIDLYVKILHSYIYHMIFNFILSFIIGSNFIKTFLRLDRDHHPSKVSRIKIPLLFCANMSTLTASLISIGLFKIDFDSTR